MATTSGATGVGASAGPQRTSRDSRAERLAGRAASQGSATAAPPKRPPPPAAPPPAAAQPTDAGTTEDDKPAAPPPDATPRPPARDGAGDGAGDGAAGLATALAFRFKLALAAGFSPELATCARCGESDGLVGFSGAAGGVVCAACEGGGFGLSPEAHGFMVEALGQPLASAPSASPRALRQAERAVSETLEHHAHVRLRAAA